MSELQKKLIRKYRNIFGISKIVLSDNNNNIFNTNIYNNTSLNIIANCSINQNLDVYKNINVTGNIECNNISTNSMVISSNSVFNSLVINDMQISNDSIIYNNLNIDSDLYCNNFINANKSIHANIVNSNIINTNEIKQLTDKINIHANHITIGNYNTQLNISGVINNINTKDLKIFDKYIRLNKIDNVDNNYYGIEILGISNTGYIRTNDNMDIFEIKPPLGDLNYLVEFDNQENIFITGNANIYKNTKIYSKFVNNNNACINNNVYCNNINISSNGTCNNISFTTVKIIENTEIAEDMFLHNLNNNSYLKSNNITNLSYINIDNICIYNNLTINSMLNVNDNIDIKINGTLLSNLNITSDIINNNCTINGNLYVSGNASLKNNNTSYNINIGGDCSINQDLVIHSGLHTAGYAKINNNVTLNNLDIKNIIILPLNHYNTNYDAVLNGIPEWGIYRTGGIVKIRLDIIPPDISLIGNSDISIVLGNPYIEPGVIALDNDGTNTEVFILSIKSSNQVDYIESKILLTNINLEITLQTPLIEDTYTITYISSDIIGNDSYITRTLHVINA